MNRSPCTLSVAGPSIAAQKNGCELQLGNGVEGSAEPVGSAAFGWLGGSLAKVLQGLPIGAGAV